jgi:hypothetical protein
VVAPVGLVVGFGLTPSSYRRRRARPGRTAAFTCGRLAAWLPLLPLLPPLPLLPLLPLLCCRSSGSA